MSDYRNENIDPLVLPMVEYFNEHGLPTYMSCQGHNDTNMSMFWIQFAKEVTEEDISLFMQQHVSNVGNFVSCGRFARRMSGHYNLLNGRWMLDESWNYFAATVEAANKDLAMWKESDANPPLDAEGVKEKFDRREGYFILTPL